MRQAEKEKKKKFNPSVHARPGQENSETNINKIQKIIKPLFGNTFSQNGMSQAEKEKKKNLVPNSFHTQPGQENFQKNCKKIQKIIKPLSSIVFFIKTG